MNDEYDYLLNLNSSSNWLLDKYKDFYEKTDKNSSFNDFLVENSFQIIKDSNEFDNEFYLKNYIISGNPIDHYLNLGYYEGCKPNSMFNAEDYVSTVEDLAGLNPFVHYLLYHNNHKKSNLEEFESSINESLINSLNKNKISTEDSINILNAFKEKISIIIPIYNAYEDTKKCIKSVFENTTVDFDLYLIDDASPDERISGLLDEYEEYDNVFIIRNETNQGFTRNVNIGLRATDTDVILLNSDTIVTPKWIQKFIFAAYSDKKIGTVTPISNASDISVPVMGQNNQIPDFLTINQMASLVEKVSINGNMEAPTGNGFCLFIKRDLINDIGLFDEESFGKGYGEETDFTQRAVNAGWKNIRNDSIFIYHKRSASFSLEKADKLKSEHTSIIKNKYPNVFIDWDKFINSNTLKKSIDSINMALNNFNNDFIKKNLLYLTDLNNNVPNVNDLTKLVDSFNIFLITLEDSFIKLWIYTKNNFYLIKEINFDKNNPNFPYLNTFYMNLIQKFNIDSVFLKFSDIFKFMRMGQNILPLDLSFELGLPIFYGDSENVLFNNLNNNFSYKIDFSKEKGVVYTAIFGEYENLLDPKFINKNLDYICFTDNPNITSDIWDVRLIKNLDLDNTRKARTIKIMAHNYLKEYDFSIWIDAGFQIIGDLEKFVNTYTKGNSLLCINHSYRDCAYLEANECIRAKKDNEDIITKQMNKYENEGFPKKYGLIESGILFRRHNNSNVIKVMEDWYSEVINFSKRDQLSLKYVLWKNNLKYDIAPIFIWKNTFFEHFYHQKLDYGTDLNKKLRIVLLDNSDNIKESINNINSISKNIPISIITSKDSLSFDSFNVNLVKYTENYSVDLNNLINKIDETFIFILNSGDILQLPVFYKINNDLENCGAIIFDDLNFDNSIEYKLPFSYDLILETDYIKNDVLLNREALIRIGGFDESLKNNYIRDVMLKLYYNNYKIIKEDSIGLKLCKKIITDSYEENKLFLTKYLPSNLSIDENLKFKFNNTNIKASIIIPFKDQPNVTKTCIKSILSKTKYPNYEIILVNNNSCKNETFRLINELSNHRLINILDYNEPFNYSKINNFAAKKATGDVLVFLNNDTEIISEDWLSLLIGDAIQPNVGAVGAKLFYPDMTIQHAGVVIGLKGLAGHLFAGETDENIPNLYNLYRRNVSAVTGACMAIEKSTFEEINGFNELFEITGSDVEICLHLMEKGYRNIYNPNIQLIHHEKKTRSRIRVRDIDIKLSIKYYGPYLDYNDPFYNKNLSLNSNKLELRKKDEIPEYKLFLDNYFKNKNNYLNKFNSIIQNKKKTKVKFDGEVLAYDVTSEQIEDNAILMDSFFKNPHLELNKTIWFVPFFDHIIRGGIYTIFRTANYMSETQGTHNTFVFDGGRRRSMEDLSKEINEAFPNLKFDVIDMVLFGEEKDLPETDAGFCTLWTSAYHLVKYNNCKAKFYFNQDYEPLFQAAGSVYGLVEETYRFNFIGIANTIGVKNKYESYGNIVKHFTPAVNRDIYFPPKEDSKDSKKYIAFYGRPNNPRNGFILGIEALKIVKAYFGDQVEIFSAGAEFDLEEYGLNGVITNLGLLGSLNEVADLYRKCDVGLVFMFTPHPSYQPFEYMACGCATVTNINEGNLWLLKDKENAILTEPVISCVADNIIKLLNNDNMRNRIVENGLKTVEKVNWNDELEKIIEFIKNPMS